MYTLLTLCMTSIHGSCVSKARNMFVSLGQMLITGAALGTIACCLGIKPHLHVLIDMQGKRYSLPNARIMIHQPLGGAQGQATDIEIQANEILHHKLTLNGYLVSSPPGSLTMSSRCLASYLTEPTP